ncbi:unnamed protein product, partial [Closterium sp. NIES-53]
VSQVDPPPLFEPLEVSSDSSSLAEGGDPAADDTAATRRSPRLETPPGFPPRPSLPPPQPGAVDFGDETAGAEPGGAEIEGEGSGGAVSGGAGTGGAATRGAASPSGGGAVGDRAGGSGAGQPLQPDLLETLSPQAIRAWIVRRGIPGGGGYGPAGAGAATPGGTTGGGGIGGIAGAGGAAGAGGTAGGVGAASAGGATGTGGTGGTAGGAGAASAGGAASTGGTRGTAGGARAASAGGTAGGGGTGGIAGGAGATSAVGAAGARGTGAVGNGGTAGAVGTRGTARGAGAAGAAGNAGGGGAGVAAGALRHLLGLPPAPTEFPDAESLTECREPETRASSPEHREHENRTSTPETRASVRARVPCVCHSRAPAVLGTHDMTLCPSSIPQRVVLPSPPASSLPAVAEPPSNLARASSPTVTCFLATVVMDPTFSSPAASALVAELVDFAAAYRLHYLASLVSDPNPACPPSVRGEVALGCDVLQDRLEELECLAAAVPHLATMLLAPEGDPDALDIPNPRSYREAISGEYSSQWQTTMDAEMAFWKSTGTYVDEVPPPGANIISGMWISRGFSGSFPEGTKWSLRRPVYSLRQTPRKWHDILRMTLAALGFAPSTVDPSLFLRTDTNLPAFYILVYVDDLVFATADTEALARVKSELQKRHTCTDLGELRSYLGLQITRDKARRTITLT